MAIIEAATKIDNLLKSHNGPQKRQINEVIERHMGTLVSRVTAWVGDDCNTTETLANNVSILNTEKK
jgi:hypothetical protein